MLHSGKMALPFFLHITVGVHSDHLEAMLTTAFAIHNREKTKLFTGTFKTCRGESFTHTALFQEDFITPNVQMVFPTKQRETITILRKLS